MYSNYNTDSKISFISKSIIYNDKDIENSHQNPPRNCQSLYQKPPRIRQSLENPPRIRQSLYRWTSCCLLLEDCSLGRLK